MSRPAFLVCRRAIDKLAGNSSDCRAKLAGNEQSAGAVAFLLASRDRAETARSLSYASLTAALSTPANTVAIAGSASLQPDGIHVGGAARLLAHPLRGA